MTIEEKLDIIFKYFGGRANKLEKLFEEAGEYRDRYLLNKQSAILEDKIIVELCDIKSCIDQLYNHEEKFRNTYESIVDKTLDKIDKGYYTK